MLSKVPRKCDRYEPFNTLELTPKLLYINFIQQISNSSISRESLVLESDVPKQTECYLKCCFSSVRRYAHQL